MDVLAGLLVLLGLLGLGTAVIMLLVKVAFKKGWGYKRTGGVAVVALVLFVSGMVMAEPSTKQGFETGKQAAKDGPVAPVLTSKQNIEKTVKNEKNVDKKTNSSKQTEKTIEQRIENTINTAVGKKTNTDKKRIVKLQVLGTEKEGKKLVLAWLNADDNLSNQMIRGGILMDSAKVFQSLFELPETEEVALVWVFPLVDVYGNSADEPVLKVRLTREIADKINWDSFDHENFAEISKQYWEHTALAE